MKSIFTQLSFCIVFLALFVANTASASVVYVSSGVTTSGAGTTWPTAFKTLQEALDAASTNSSIDQVWVMAGTYYPTAYPIGSTGNLIVRDYAFSLKKGLAIYGGFDGTETAITGRMPGNTTVLSGDIGVVGNNFDNCYHVVIAVNVDNTAVLDGVTITLGKANAVVPLSGALGANRSYGGGLYNTGASPTISNCVLSYNVAVGYAGGMYNAISSPIVTGCTFFADTVVSSSSKAVAGAGMCNQTLCNPVVSDCMFTGNVAISNASISGSISSGSAIQNGGGCTLTLSNCTFYGNGIYGNGGGGGFMNTGIVIAKNCLFSNNFSGAATGAGIGSGGAIQSEDGIATLTNCIFEGNKANGINDDGGGAIMNYKGAVNLINCTLSNNTTQSSYNTTAHGIATYPSGTTNITNSILWGASAQVLNKGITTVSYSNIKGGYTGTGNIEADPSFANAVAPAGADGIWATTDDGLALKCMQPVYQHWHYPFACCTD